MVNLAKAIRVLSPVRAQWLVPVVIGVSVVSASWAEDVVVEIQAPAAAAPAAATASSPKEGEKEPEREKKDAALGASDAGRTVNDGQVLGFRQAEIAAQMNELEERMFRLAEAVKQLEPENSSRLMLGLKFAREEFILQQMKETQQLLDKLSLGEAMAEQKLLLAKLQRLHDMLVSADLDLQVRLERLRQVREILRRLDKAIVEEDREQRQSRQVAALEKHIEHLRPVRASLERLRVQQRSHVDHVRPLAAVESPDDEQVRLIAELAKALGATRAEARKLSASESQGGMKLEQLDAAADKMAEAQESLAAKQASWALEKQEAALQFVENQLMAVANELEATEKELTAEAFVALEKDQAMNRQFTGDIGDLVRKLGDSGASPLANLQVSTASMSAAENRLAKRQAEPASADQTVAVAALKKARQQLSGELSKLLDQLRAEVKRRVLEDLSLMLEKQIAIRESTVGLGKRVESGGRQVVASIIALSASEARLVNIADELVALVEETGFGIALPAALTMVRDAMAGVKSSLAAADASQSVVDREQAIEADLKDLLAAMKQLPSKGPSQDAAQQDAQGERERELNRLVAELRMIRVVQNRVNGATLQVDGRRQEQLETVSVDVRRQIEGVTNQQDDVRDVTEQLFTERADEMP